MTHGERLRFGVALAAGVVLPGLATFALSAAGYPALGTLAFVAGYTAAVVVVWYHWLRPLDLTGPVE